MGDVFAFSLNISYIVLQVFVCHMIQTKLKGCAMNKRLIIFMLLLGVFSIKAMELDGSSEEGSKTTHKTTHTTKHKTKTKKGKTRDGIFGYKRGTYGSRDFKITVDRIIGNELQVSVSFTVDLESKELIETLLTKGLADIDQRNYGRKRGKRVVEINETKVPNSLKFRALVVDTNEGGLYTKEELLPMILIQRQKILFSNMMGKPIGKKKKLIRSRQRLERSLSTSNLKTKRHLTKEAEKRDKED